MKKLFFCCLPLLLLLFLLPACGSSQADSVDPAASEKTAAADSAPSESSDGAEEESVPDKASADEAEENSETENAAEDDTPVTFASLEELSEAVGMPLPCPESGTVSEESFRLIACKGYDLACYTFCCDGMDYELHAAALGTENDEDISDHDANDGDTAEAHTLFAYCPTCASCELAGFSAVTWFTDSGRYYLQASAESADFDSAAFQTEAGSFALQTGFTEDLFAEDDSGYEDEYTGIIESLASALENGEDLTGQELSSAYLQLSAESVGIVMNDLSGDGLPELAIGAADTESGTLDTIYDLFSVDADGNITHAFCGGDQDRLLLGTDGQALYLIRKQVSESGEETSAYYYLENGALVELTAAETGIEPASMPCQMLAG